MKRRKVDATDLIEFNRAISIITDKVLSSSDEDLQLILSVQNNLLRLTLSRIQKKRSGHDPGN